MACFLELWSFSVSDWLKLITGRPMANQLSGADVKTTGSFGH
jgi:hypothetical protein